VPERKVVVDQAQGTGHPASLTSLLHDSRISWDDLHDRYDPLLRLVDALLGVVPNCDRYLEIWPPAFRTYNVMVPNLLNLPVPVLGGGGPPPGVVGLAMYVASRSAGCAYCSAHSCSFAMRRGASPETLAAALLPDRETFSRGELATIAVASSLGRVPCELTITQKNALVGEYGERKAEWIALGAVMMGFLNKFMDAVGVELEQPVLDEVSPTMGADWSPGKAGADLDPAAPRGPAPPVDGLRSRLRLVPLFPAAIRWDRRAQRGVPGRWPALGAHLQQHTGHDFAVLDRLQSKRAARAVATMLCTNLDPATTVVGLEAKVLAGLAFAAVVENPQLRADLHALARHLGLDDGLTAAVAEFAIDDTALPPTPEPAASAALVLTRAAAYSPARIDAATVQTCDGVLPPAAVIEIVTWLSVLQLLHRLTCWVEPPA